MNNTFYAPNDYRYYLEHHGVKGMRWGVRRYQNADGSYTSAGRERYGTSGSGAKTTSGIKGALRSAGRKISGADLTPEQRAARNDKIKKVALVVAGTAVVAAGAYAAHKYLSNTNLRVDELAEYATSKETDAYFNKVFGHMDGKSEALARSDKARLAGDRLTQELEYHNAWGHEQSIRDLNNKFNLMKEASGDRAYRSGLRKSVIKDDIEGLRQRAMANRMGYRGVPLDRSTRDIALREKARDSLRKATDDALYNQMNERLGGQTVYEKQLREFANRQARKVRGY